MARRPVRAGGPVIEPNSVVLVVVLLAAAAGLLWVLVRYRHIAIRIASGVLALALSVGAGMAIVNDYYGYYQSWSQLAADLSGSYGSFATTTAVRTSTGTAVSGRLERISLVGPQSKIARQAFVYLPPQYFEAKYATTQFPVIELLHGTPGSPLSIIVHLNIVKVLGRLLADHEMGPTVVVLPSIEVGRQIQECVDAPGALDDTYLTQDVRTVIEAKYRVSRVSAEWGIGGYSSGGYCAANLALRHRDLFGASGVIDGYYRPQDGPAAQALHFDPAAEAANDPLQLAASLPRDASPLPSFWISAGTGDAADEAEAQAFADALHGVEQVALFREPNAGHNFYAWAPALPRMLAWMWTQLAPPELRADFPIAGAVQNSTIIAPGAADSKRPVKAPRMKGVPSPR